jgi:hypothetical protein
MRNVTLSAIAALALTASCAGSRAQQPTAQAPSPQAPVASRHPYEMKGRVQAVGAGFLGLGGRSITIDRDGAPAAVLHVAEGTRVSVNGRDARLGDVRAGDDVRAAFDFDSDKPVAIQIDARTHR